MSKIDDMTRKLCEQYDLTMSDMWEIRGAGTMVLKNRAIEKIASKEKIRFDRPEIIEGSLKEQAIVLLVTGHKGEDTVSSFASATMANCTTAVNKGGPKVFHPYAYEMAEKRGKARVTLKLISMYGDFYSEDEISDEPHSKNIEQTKQDDVDDLIQKAKEPVLNVLFMHVWREFFEGGSSDILKSIKDRQILLDLYAHTDDKGLRDAISECGRALKEANNGERKIDGIIDREMLNNMPDEIHPSEVRVADFEYR